MESCPCQNCQERRIVCHDHCEAYLAYHEAMLVAKQAIKAQREAIRAVREVSAKRYIRARHAEGKK